MKQHIRAIALLSLAAPALFAQTPAIETDVPELPTTIITGDLWESALQATTASVTLLDEAALASNGTQHFEDVINAIPNLTWTGGSSRPRYIQIRGIGENSQFEGETPDSSVRFLIDDLDLTGLGTVGNLFDVQQVEVLRGPQAGAFGANAAGGVIKIVTNGPTSYWTGQAEATVGNDDLRAAGVAVGGPLLENDPEQLSFRLAVHQLQQNGFRENVFLNKDDTNGRDELTTRLKLRWLANENWQLDGQLFYADADNGYDVFTLSNERTDTFSDRPGRDEQESIGTSLRATYRGWDQATITSITSYTVTDSTYSYDSDWGSGDALGSSFPSAYNGFLETIRDRKTISQEIRLDSKDQHNAWGIIDRWTLGFYYHDFNETSDIAYQESSTVFAYAGNTRIESEYEAETYAIFAQLGHDFSANSRLIFGLRFENHAVNFQSDTPFDTLGYASPGSSQSQQRNDLIGGQLTLEQDLSDAHRLYGRLTRGYKSGGANSGTFNQPGDPLTYEQETLWNYEIGLRSEWLDGQIESNITVFYLDRSNAQLRDSAGAGGFFRYFTSNQGEAEHYGAEAQATSYITENWTVSTSLGVLETKADTGNPDLANAPSYNYSVRIDYRPSRGLFGSLEIVGSDHYYESNSHSQKRTAFTVINASIGYRYKNLTLTLWSKNLFDQQYESRIFFFDNNFDGNPARYEAPAAPRTFGITANYSW